jgi:hypothetical protein
VSEPEFNGGSILVIFWKKGGVGGLQKRGQRGSPALALMIEIYKTPLTCTQRLGQPERMDALEQMAAIDDAPSSLVARPKQRQTWANLWRLNLEDREKLLDNLLSALRDRKHDHTSLLTLQLLLDQECVRLMRQKNLDTQQTPLLDVIAVERGAASAVGQLCGSLGDCVNRHTSCQREVQFRALKQALALCQYHEVKLVRPDFWHNLHQQLAGRYREVTWDADDNASLEERQLEADCSYLIRLVSECARALRRAEPVAFTGFKAFLNLLYAAGTLVSSLIKSCCSVS